jgi:hypothetical protein
LDYNVNSSEDNRVALSVCIRILILAYLIAGVWIGRAVVATAAEARALAPGDSLEALLAVVESADRPLAERNRAVWALGQLGDRRALLVLDRHYTARRCDHESCLCQREIKKARELIGGGLNITAPVWRNRLFLP